MLMGKFRFIHFEESDYIVCFVSVPIYFTWFIYFHSMIFRFVSLFFLAANASAFVVNPNFVTRNSISCGPLLSSSSTLMSDTSADENATDESPIINGALEDDISVNLEETVEESVDVSPSDDSSPTQLPETQRHTVYVGNLPFCKNKNTLLLVPLFSILIRSRYPSPLLYFFVSSRDVPRCKRHVFRAC